VTRRELYNYVRAQDCFQTALPEGKAHVVYFENRVTEAKAWLNLPIDDRPVKDYTVYKLCLDLGIPIPDHAAYWGDTQDQIDRALNN
jgi:hypothetical protein